MTNPQTSQPTSSRAARTTPVVKKLPTDLCAVGNIDCVIAGLVPDRPPRRTAPTATRIDTHTFEITGLDDDGHTDLVQFLKWAHEEHQVRFLHQSSKRQQGNTAATVTVRVWAKPVAANTPLPDFAAYWPGRIVDHINTPGLNLDDVGPLRPLARTH